jgi:hypothetical protein
MQGIENVRNAENWDEWLLGQSLLSGRLRTVISVIEEIYEEVPVGVKALLSQLEEILADAGGLFLLFKTWQNSRPYHSSFATIKVTTQANKVLMIF